MNQKEKKLYEQLLASPVVELTGIVNARGVGGGRSLSEKLWTLSFDFDAWRTHDGPIRSESLMVRRRVTDNEMKQLKSAIAAETIVRIRGRVAEENVFGSKQALLEEYLGLADDDVAMNDLLKQLLEPQTVEDARLGSFTFDRRFRQYKASITWGGVGIDLVLDTDQREELEACLQTARALWSQEESWKQRIEKFAVEKLLPLKNAEWLDDEEAKVSPDDFLRRIELVGISLSPDGGFDFSYDDGDLFWGHGIEIQGTLVDGPTDADLCG